MEIPGALWTADQLCQFAATEDLAASARLIRDWGDVGLLDRPPTQSRGRAGMSPSVWPDRQRLLFLLELRKRAEGAPIPALCKLPVFLWLQYGDEHVPLRQVRRALATWAEAARRPAASRAFEVAATTSRELAHPDAPRRARKHFEETIGRGQAGEVVAPAKLLAAARAAFDPGGMKQPRGPDGAPLTAEEYVEQVQALVRAAEIVVRDRKGRELPDDVFYDARQIYRESRVLYAREWRRFAADPELGHLHRAPTADSLVNAAARDLLELLAHWLRANRGWRWATPSRPSNSGASRRRKR